MCYSNIIARIIPHNRTRILFIALCFFSACTSGSKFSRKFFFQKNVAKIFHTIHVSDTQIRLTSSSNDNSNSIYHLSLIKIDHTYIDIDTLALLFCTSNYYTSNYSLTAFASSHGYDQLNIIHFNLIDLILFKIIHCIIHIVF
jgi:hypothetical protein